MEPFYMTFPMQNLFQAELEYERDFERMKEMYPRETAKIAAMVSDRCDELEYEGSRIYDENPDRRMMEREAQNLYESIKASFSADAPGAQVRAEEAVAVEESMTYAILPPAEWNLEGAAEQSPTDLLTGQEGYPPAPGPFIPEGPNPSGMPPAPPAPSVMQGMPPAPPIPGEVPPGPCTDWLCSVVGILFSNEIYRRRCRYRRSRRWW